jgi:sec-independent protein translocase protein TatA
MLSVPDMAIIGALALIFFGPEQLPKVARRFGHVMRDMQSTSQAFIRELERAADEYEPERDPNASEAHPHAEAPENVTSSGRSDIQV